MTELGRDAVGKPVIGRRRGDDRRGSSHAHPEVVDDQVLHERGGEVPRELNLNIVGRQTRGARRSHDHVTGDESGQPHKRVLDAEIAILLRAEGERRH